MSREPIIHNGDIESDLVLIGATPTKSLVNLVRTTYCEGYQAGHKDGYEEGYSAGHAEGEADQKLKSELKLD